MARLPPLTMTKKWVKCSRRRARQRRLLLAEICHIGAMAVDENNDKPNTMKARVCMEAVAELTKAGWPFGKTLVITLNKREKKRIYR